MGTPKEGTVWSAPAGKLASASTKLWNRLGERGAGIIERLDDDAEYSQRVAEFILREGLIAPIHQKLVRAHEIMGKNFFSAGDWISLYGANFTKKQLRQIAKFPWGEDILNSTCLLYGCNRRVKECHFAFVGLDRLNGQPLTILKWQELHPATGQPRFNSYNPDEWYSEQKFAQETTMDFRWYLLHQNIVPKSENEMYKTQVRMLPPSYEVPSAITELTKDLLVFRKKGDFANPVRDARCRCIYSDYKSNNQVLVCRFGSGVLDIGWGDSTFFGIGLAASRLPGR